MRDMLFVSHANPEDNEFALWLTRRLSADGYSVWCDNTRLLGGEDFWRVAETAIRTRTYKFLYVLSKTSNVKDGPRNELQIAVNVAKTHKLHDFIIPLRVDDLPYTEMNILLTRLIAIPFEIGWASGYQQLLTKLASELEWAIIIKQVGARMDGWTRNVWRARAAGYSWEEISRLSY